MVEPSDNWIKRPSDSLSPATGEGVVIDIGTGDGRFVYQCARENPGKFYIGIDANARPLEKTLRPFFGAPDMPFEIVRELGGNFYTDLFRSISHVLGAR